MVTRASLLRQGRQSLTTRNASFEAQELLFHILKIRREDYFFAPNLSVSETEAECFLDGINRLCSGEPLAYLLGNWDFFGRSFLVNPGVLIPRPETESVIEAALKLLPSQGHGLDLCTGSGCIGITLALEKPGLSIDLGDISPQALETARKNAALYPQSAVRVIYDDALSPSFTPYDFIISNPPYIAVGEEVDAAVLTYEPALALWGGADGLDFYRSILTHRIPSLTAGGILLVECGEKQSDKVASLFTLAGLTNINIIKDLSGKGRGVYGIKEKL